eukprot:7259798-Karenia_brevis.AAC.1
MSRIADGLADMVQYQPDLDVLGSSHTNMPAWVEFIKSRPINRSWCAYVGRIHTKGSIVIILMSFVGERTPFQ